MSSVTQAINLVLHTPYCQFSFAAPKKLAAQASLSDWPKRLESLLWSSASAFSHGSKNAFGIRCEVRMDSTAYSLPPIAYSLQPTQQFWSSIETSQGTGRIAVTTSLLPYLKM